jgi:hypothetical protein
LREDAVRLVRLAAGATVILAGASQAIAQNYGLGVNSCADFARTYAANPKLVEDTYFVWAAGFMSGLNLDAAAFGRPYRIINSNDTASYKLRIRSYCDEHPLVPYAHAVADLYTTLPAANSK